MIRSALLAALVAWAGAASAQDASALAGHTIHEYLGSDAVAAQVAKLMGSDAYGELARSTDGPGGVFEPDGEYVVAAGCKRHMCDEVFYAVAIHNKTGRATIAFKGYEQKPRLWGDAPSRMPNEVARVMTNQPFNDR